MYHTYYLVSCSVFGSTLDRSLTLTLATGKPRGRLMFPLESKARFCDKKIVFVIGVNLTRLHSITTFLGGAMSKFIVKKCKSLFGFRNKNVCFK